MDESDFHRILSHWIIATHVDQPWMAQQFCICTSNPALQSAYRNQSRQLCAAAANRSCILPNQGPAEVRKLHCKPVHIAVLTVAH